MKNKRDAVVVLALRTPVGKMRKSLATVPANDLAAHVMKAAVKRVGLDPASIDEIIFGNLFNYDWANMARVSSLTAGFPLSLPAVTIDRQCSSSLNAVAYAGLLINTGNADIVLAGGVESYSQQPLMVKRPETPFPGNLEMIPGVKVSVDAVGNPPMIRIAETMAVKYNVTREECDEFACRSHRLAGEAWAAGRFDEQVVDYQVVSKKKTVTVHMDDCVRPNCTMEDLQKLPPVYEGGLVTAGNSSPMNDGASAVLVMSRERAEALNLEILAKVGPFAAAGCDPNLMGIGPVYATKKLLQRTGLKLEDIDLIELNEAFASQSLSCCKVLGLDMEKLNVNGGAIAIGHPNAASGGILVARLIYEMRRRDVKRGLVTFCTGGGQGFSVVFERD